MNILVIGSGGREHTLVWKIAQSPKIKKLYCAPGNIGISKNATCIPIDINDIDGLLEFAIDKKIDMTVVGPEGPLSEGLTDRFESFGLKVFGASKAATRIESSKSFAKDLMKKCNIPTAKGEVFTDVRDAKDYIVKADFPIVVKADGLAAGKGVIICHTLSDALTAIDRIIINKEFGSAGEKIIIEEFLEGEEASFMVITDGEYILSLPSSQDHKRLLDNDRGPNTGGMGAYSPAPIVGPFIQKLALETVMIPIINAMKKEGYPYKGVLYAGLMINKGKIKVLEFNARFGDPETQAVLPRIKSDIVPIMEATVNGNLNEHSIDIDKRSSVCVVMASSGYPNSYKNNLPIFGLDAQHGKDTYIFYASTDYLDGEIVATGGRVLGIVALDETLKEAIDKVYSTTSNISWEGSYYRKDIGQKGL